MKRTHFISFVSALLLCTAPAAFAQKAEAVYLPGLPQYKTCEPWMCEIIKSENEQKQAHWWHVLAAWLKNEKPDNLSEEKIYVSKARAWAQTVGHLKQLAQRQGKTEADVLLRYRRLQNALTQNPLMGKYYTLWVPAMAADDVNHLSDEGFKLVQTVLGTRPDQPGKRPEPAAAWKVQNDFVRVEFKTASETVHMGFDLKKHTVEIYQNIPSYGIKNNGDRVNLIPPAAPALV